MTWHGPIRLPTSISISSSSPVPTDSHLPFVISPILSCESYIRNPGSPESHDPSNATHPTHPTHSTQQSHTPTRRTNPLRRFNVSQCTNMAGRQQQLMTELKNAGVDVTPEVSLCVRFSWVWVLGSWITGLLGFWVTGFWDLGGVWRLAFGLQG
jgi:hypothetical protein